MIFLKIWCGKYNAWIYRERKENFFDIIWIFSFLLFVESSSEYSKLLKNKSSAITVMNVNFPTY